MALHRFMGVEIGVPEPEALAACYEELGPSGSWDVIVEVAPPEPLTKPPDLDAIAKAREAEGR